MDVPPDVLVKIRQLEEELQEGDITQQGFDKKKAKLLAPYISSDGVSIGSDSSSHSQSPLPPSYDRNQSMEARNRAAAIQAVLEQNRSEDILPRPSRRYTAEKRTNYTISPSQSFESTPLESSSSSRTATPQQTVTPPPVMPKPSPARLKAPQQHLQPPGANGPGGVSHKIQQLLNTLKRPKKNRRPIEDFFTDDDNDRVAPVEDPSAPRPVGPMMQPITGMPLESRQDWHRNLEAAIQHHSTALPKLPAVTVVDNHGKPSVAYTFSKLATKALKVAHLLLNKAGGGKLLQPGDRVALVFRSDEVANFIAAFWGCIYAAVLPLAIHPPVTKDDPGSQQMGFLLNSLGITVAITSEQTLKQLPKEDVKDYIVQFKGWPKLSWVILDHLPKPSKDFNPPQRPTPDTTAYIEFSTDKDGSALGVSISRSALLTHCRSITTACQYKQGETLVVTEDPKHSVGLWHGIMVAAYVGLHVVFVPPTVMAVQPTAWLHMIHKQKASCVISSSKSLNACIPLATHKELREIRLDNIRLLLLEDGANPWSLASSDLFYEAYSPRGLVREALCPCSGSPETLTVSIRRPIASTPSGRGVMSISGLSYGVVRVEELGSITSLTLQDVGMVMPGATVAVVKVSGQPILCKTDEVGEICIQSVACGQGYWGLQSKTANTFMVQALDESEVPVAQGGVFARTGLLGFVGEGGMVFVCGRMNGLIQIGARRHNTEDLIATVMAVEPHSFVYKARIAVFSVTVLKEERVVVVAEQSPSCSDEEAFTWMNSVVPAVESIHGINLYAIVLVPPGRLPKYSNGELHVHETRARFLEGSLHPVNLLMCPNQCITNLPVPKQQPAVTGAAQIIGDLVTGRAMESDASHLVATPSDDSTDGPDTSFLSDALRWRSQNRPDDVLFTTVDTKGHVSKTINSINLYKRAERIGAYLTEKIKLNSGDHAGLVYSPGIDLIVAFYGCVLVGIVPVIVKPPSISNLQGSLAVMKMTLELSKSRAILSTHQFNKLLKSKEANQCIDPRALPPLVDTDDLPKKKLAQIYRPPTPELIAYLDFCVSSTGVLSGVKVSHAAVYQMCKIHKSLLELYPSREVVLCLDPYSGLGSVLWCLSGIFAGHNTFLINPYDLEVNPLLWLTVLSQNKIRDTFCSYAVIDLCIRELGTAFELLKSKNIDLSHLRSCTIVSEERPRVHLLNSFTTLFSIVGLSPRAVCTSFGCRVNPMVCLQGPRQPEATSIYADSRALRMDRVVILEKGAPHSMCLTESGKMVAGSRVVIVNPENKKPCAHTDLGEIWVSSINNASGYYGLKERANDTLSIDHFQATLAGGGDMSIQYARTGYLGFMLKSDKIDETGAAYQSLYVVGSVDESLTLRGFRYHPVDIEASVIRCHKNICNSAVFLSNKLLVVVAELHGDENEALDVVPVITTTLLEEHQLVTGIVVVVDPSTIPVNSRGEKQRIHLRDNFLADSMDPIYVAYNL